MTELQRVAPLLDLDPDLGQFLDEHRLEAARRRLLVRARRLTTGPWETDQLNVSDPGHLGLLVLDGVLSREVLAADVISTELIGGGELLRPWQMSPDASLLRVAVRWSVLAEARVAVIDRRVTRQLADYPEILSLLVERMAARAQRLAVTQAISQLVGARRPTVSTAIGELSRDGQIRRMSDGSWMLMGEPAGEPAGRNIRVVPPRRRLIAVSEA